MSIEIPVSYVNQFSSRVHNLAEQRYSRLRPTVTMEPFEAGESFTVERVGNTDKPNPISNLHGDTPLDNTPHSRRWGYLKGFDTADLIDKQSRVRLLIEPDSVYVQKHSGKMGRGMDDEIISALGGTAAEGKNGTTLVALPSAQKIAHGSVGLTVAKLMEAKRRLDAAEVDDFATRFMVATSTQIMNLLEDDKVASNDFNTVKALVRGEVDEYLGFKFIRSERLLKVSTSRFCYAYTQDAVRFCVAVEPNSIASDRPDKRHSKQIYTYGEWGAVRAEDVRVVEIECTE